VKRQQRLDFGAQRGIRATGIREERSALGWGPRKCFQEQVFRVLVERGHQVKRKIPRSLPGPEPDVEVGNIDFASKLTLSAGVGLDCRV
jgi:hypothetical protein